MEGPRTSRAYQYAFLWKWLDVPTLLHHMRPFLQFSRPSPGWGAWNFVS